MDEKLKQLTTKKQKLDIYRPLPPELVQNLDEWFKVELTYSSNAIEGNTLTRVETAEILDKGITAAITGKPLRDQLEAINHGKALEFTKKLAEKLKSHQFIKEDNIKSIHKIILKGIQDAWAGKYRQTRVLIRGTDIELPEANQIPSLMSNFIKWLATQQKEHPVIVATLAHFKFESIHPFVDGNGRVGRLLLNLILLLSGYPMAVIRNEERIAYLKALNVAQTNNDLLPLQKLIIEAVDRSLDIYLKAVEPERESIVEPSSEQRFYTTKEVAKLLQVDPESVRRYVRSNKLKAVRLGGKFIRIDRADLDKFIEGLKS